MKTSLLIAVAVFNEAVHLPELLRQLKPFKDDVVVIDDGSSDSSAEIAISNGFEVVKFPSNAGIASVYRAVFSFATQNNKTHVIFMDGDGQHNPVSIPFFETALQKHSFVLGSRFSDPENVPEAKIASNLFAVLLIADSFGITMPDVACGFRGFQQGDSWPLIAGAFGYEVIYSTLIDQIVKGVNPQFIKMDAVYPPQEVYYTQNTELLGLLSAVARKTSNDLLHKIQASVAEQSDINVHLGEFNFFAKSIPHGYVFQTDTDKAKHFFRNLNTIW